MPTLWDRMSEAEKVAKVAEVVMEWQKCHLPLSLAEFWMRQKEGVGSVIVDPTTLLSWPGEGFSLIVEAMRKRGFICQDFWMRDNEAFAEFRMPHKKKGVGGVGGKLSHAAAIAALKALGEGKLFEEER